MPIIFIRKEIHREAFCDRYRIAPENAAIAQLFLPETGHTGIARPIQGGIFMHQTVTQNARYQIQHVFVGTKPVSELIEERVCAQTTQILPLTTTAPAPYNPEERTVVRRYNGQ